MDWWFKLRLLNWYRLTRGMTDAEAGRYMSATVDALADRKYGATEFADLMLAEAEEYAAKQSQRRRKKPVDGGGPRKTTVDGGGPDSTNKDEDEDEDEKKKKLGVHHDTSGSESGKSKSPFSWSELNEDKQLYVWTVPEVSLPAFATWFCQEEDNARARAVYGKFIKKFGSQTFRILLDKFVSAVFAGEEPDNRGAAFMATVIKSGKEAAEEAKQNQNNQSEKSK